MTTDDNPDIKAARTSQVPQPEDMGIHERALDQEDPEWVAARLPNPATDESRHNNNEG